MSYRKVEKDLVAGDVINGDKIAGDKVAGNKVLIIGKTPVKVILEQAVLNPVEVAVLKYVGEYEWASPKSIAEGTNLPVGDVYEYLLNSEKFGQRGGLFYRKPEVNAGGLH